MKYNLAQYSQTESSGDITLTTDEIISVISGTSANILVPASGTSSGTLTLECDLGARVYVGEVQYYFDSAVPMSTVASGIEFSYKNEDFEVYTNLNTYYNENYYYTIVSGTDAPRYIKVEHTVVSGAGGYLNGLQVLNDDTYVDFGTDGTDTNHNVNLSLEDALVEISELQVYNSGPVKANVKIVLEPQNTVADNILAISSSTSGPWYGVYEDTDKLAGPSLWDTGNYNNTEEVGDVLKLTSSYTEGTYTTRIIELTSDQKLTRVLVPRRYPAASSFISVDGADTLENIEVRSSNTRPMDRDSYIECYDNTSIALRYRWAEDGTVDTTGPNLGENWGDSSTFWEVWNDSITENNYLVLKPFGTGGDTDIKFAIKRKSGAYYEITLSSIDYDNKTNYNTYRLSPNSAEGFWVYYYIKPKITDTTGYYRLRYYDSTLGQVYNRQANDTQGSFLYDLSSVYDSNGDMWYTDRDLSTVFKINRTGTILTSYLATEDIRGIMALDDGGCWFIQAQALIRLNSSGKVVNTITLSTSTASYVYSDMSDGFWLHDGWIIRHLGSDGTEYFNVEITNLLWITVMNSGVITKQHDGTSGTKPEASYVSKYHKKVMRTWDYPQNEGGWKGNFDYNRYGARSHAYDDIVDDHASNFPIAIDTSWNNFAEWNKVSLRDYNFSNEQYHQVRITLRADSSSNSPEVDGIFTQRAIEISNIYPNNYSNFYLRTSVGGLSTSDTGDYTSEIRAYWFLDAE